MSDRCIVSVKFTAVSQSGGLRRAVAGFLRYVQYRDHHVNVEREETTEVEVSGLLRYVAHRDRAASQGRLFGPDGAAGDLERKQLAAYVMRSVGDLDAGRSGRP